MRAILLFSLALLTLCGCTRSTTPPEGRWEGAYDSGGTMIVARLEIGHDGQVRISVPDVAGVGGDEGSAMRDSLAERLAGGWGDVSPRPMDFDGQTFRKPGGFAPQIDYDKSSNTMTVYVYLGTNPAIRVPLHAVTDFSDNPWPH